MLASPKCVYWYQKVSVRNKETFMDPRHGDTNWDYSDQLIEKTRNLYDKIVTF